MENHISILEYKMEILEKKKIDILTAFVKKVEEIKDEGLNKQ